MYKCEFIDETVTYRHNLANSIMPKIFICYSRHSQEIVEELASDIKELGYDVWFDQELSGGQAWWGQILERIRKCDVFVFALAQEALDSSACNLELKYASGLSKTVLPIMVADVDSINLLPSALSVIQHVDYRQQGKQTVFAVNKAINNLPASQPLPEPMPIPPQVPISYLGVLKNQIETNNTLNFPEQSVLVLKLKDGLQEINDVNIVCDLLEKMRKRKDLFSNIAEEIDNILTNNRYSSFGKVMSSKTNPWRRKILRWVLIIIVPIMIIATIHSIIQNVLLKQQLQKIVKIPTNVPDNKADYSKWTIQIIYYYVSNQQIKKARDLAKAIKNMTNYNTFVAKRGNELVVCMGKFNSKDSNEIKEALKVIRELEYKGRKDFESSYPIQVR